MKFRNAIAVSALLTSLTLGFVLFTFTGCESNGSDAPPVVVVNPLDVDCGLPYQAVLGVEDCCTGADIAVPVVVTATPTATTDGTLLSDVPVPVAEATPVNGIYSLSPLTACTVQYRGTIDADGYESETIGNLSPKTRYMETCLLPEGGQCLDVCPAPPPCPECEVCQVCEVCPTAGYASLNECRNATPTPPVNDTIDLYYCCNVQDFKLSPECVGYAANP